MNNIQISKKIEKTIRNNGIPEIRNDFAAEVICLPSDKLETTSDCVIDVIVKEALEFRATNKRTMLNKDAWLVMGEFVSYLSVNGDFPQPGER